MWTTANHIYDTPHGVPERGERKSVVSSIASEGSTGGRLLLWVSVRSRVRLNPRRIEASSIKQFKTKRKIEGLYKGFLYDMSPSTSDGRKMVGDYYDTQDFTVKIFFIQTCIVSYLP